jgi:F0F1-type ATP synthase assembly protein I
MHKIPKSRLSGYGKYSGIATQMIVIILLFVYGGYKLDEYLRWKYPVFLIGFSFLGVIVAIYIVVRELLQK